MSEEFDLIVIGAGSGGVRAARLSAGYGAKVAVVEERFAGGTCVNVGCVPKKLFVSSADLGHHIKQAKGFGWEVPNCEFSWPQVRDNQLQEVARLQKIYRKLLDNAGVHWIDGRAKFLDNQSVQVGPKVYRAKKILIATGSTPNKPSIPGIEKALVSDHMFTLPELPKTATVVGGGYIAVEFAGILNGFGVDVSLVIRKDKVLSGFDEDIRAHVHECLKERGIRMITGQQIKSVEENQGKLTLHTDQASYESDIILNALGRKPLTEGLGLENTKVTLSERGTVEVDATTYQTQEPSIFAVGDVTGGLQLTPVALAEGMSFAKQNYAGLPPSVTCAAVPTAVFSQPEIGTVGVGEEEALRKHDVDVYMSSFKPLQAALSGSQEKIIMKMIVDQKDQKVLGIHMVGPHAGEIIQGLAVGITAGMTKSHMDQTIGVHPTMAEEFVTMRESVRSVKRG